MRAERYLDAQICCQQALGLDFDHADTLHLMGLLSLQAKRHDHAVEWLSRATRQDPKPAYLSSLGITLQHQGRHEEALKTFDKAVQLKPDDAELWSNLGTVLMDIDRPDDAILTFKHVLELDPQHVDAAYRIGFLLHRLGRLEEALCYLDLSEQLQPDHVPTLQVRGLSLRGLKRFDEALADSRRALTLDPTNAETTNNIGAIHESSGRQEEALQWYDKAIELRPNFSGAFNNKAYLLGQMQRFDQAFALYDHIKALGLNDAVSEWNLSLLHMLTGNFEAGWAGREARWSSAVRSISYPKFARPMWRGEESIEGRTILIHADEGFGDTIQFARYVPMVAARGARVILVVADAAYPLLSGLPGVSLCFSKSAATLPDFDLHCPISSLPLAFGTRLDSIPSSIS
jgi:tetratricopeptide (TPR) repeat protein